MLLLSIIFVALTTPPDRQQAKMANSKLRTVEAFAYVGFIWLMIFLIIVKILIIAAKATARYVGGGQSTKNQSNYRRTK